MSSCTDRTITFKVRTDAWGAQSLFRSLGHWIDHSGTLRSIDMYEQRVDGELIKDKVDDFTKEFPEKKDCACSLCN